MYVCACVCLCVSLFFFCVFLVGWLVGWLVQFVSLVCVCLIYLFGLFVDFVFVWYGLVCSGSI